VRRLLPVVAALLLVAGCGGGDQTTTVTTTAPEPPAGDATPTGPTDTGANEAEPPPQEPRGDRIDIGTFYAFEMPSKRIGCAVTTDPTTLRCDTAFPTRFSRARRTCEFGDFGQAFLLRRSGAARPICAGDTVLSATDSHAFPYGKTWLLGPYSCISRKTGLSCRNPEGHGMSLSLEAQKVF
jgi:hypothetical protein